MEWTQAVAVIAAVTGVIGLQSFWISRALDRVHAALDRLDVRLDRIEDRVTHLEGREPPTLRRV